jgi:hypothetical protein
MKRSRLAKGEERLASSESLLRASLLEVLPGVASGGFSLLFTNSKYNPHGFPTHRIDREAEAFLELALACVELREHLRLPMDGTVGELFLAACEEAASSDEHRRGPRRLAEALLQRLRDGG